MEETKSGLPPKSGDGSLSRKAIKQKRPVIDARRQSGATSEASNARASDRPKSLRDMKMINQAFSQHFIFTSLTEENTDALVESMQHFELGSGKTLFEQNEPAKYFFVLVTGKLEVCVNGKRVNYVNPGEGFGELALLHDTPRSATIRSIERSTMWGLNRKDFREAIAQVNSINYIETKTFIDSVPLLQSLTSQQRDATVHALTTHTFQDGSRIVNEGDPGDLFYLIKEGTVVCTKKGTEIRRLGRGDYFGELALLYNSQRTATVCAVGEVK